MGRHTVPQWMDFFFLGGGGGMSPHTRLIWILDIVLQTPSADLCMGWVPPGGLGLPGTAAAPLVARVWGAPAGRPEHPDSSWRWCSTPRSSAGATLRGVHRVECVVEVEREEREEKRLYYSHWLQAFFLHGLMKFQSSGMTDVVSHSLIVKSAEFVYLSLKTSLQWSQSLSVTVYIW